MKRYTLLTADMDGTVLNTRKEITPRTAGAIHQALADGWEVLFATGRCLAEVRPYLTDFPDMHYLLCHSGATVTDLRTGQDLCSLPIDPETVEKVLAVTADALARMRALPHVRILGSDKAEEHNGILTFVVDNVHPHDVSELLAADGVAVRAGHHCAEPLHHFLGYHATVRASFAFYNDKTDVDRLVGSLSTVRGRMGYDD